MKKTNIAVIFTLIAVLCAVVTATAFFVSNRDNVLSAGTHISTESGEQNTQWTGAPLLRDQPGHTPTVVLDAGHGFGDVGCAGPETALGAYEHQLTMDMVASLKASLEERGVKVILTHDGQSFPSVSTIAAMCDELGVEYDTTKSTWVDDNIFAPYERVIYMNALDAKYGVNFALSVHVNANVDSNDLNGFDLDYCTQNPWSAQSKVYAEKLKETLNGKYPGRNLWYYEDSWEDAFIVTKYNSMPSALLETGYYTNSEDAALLRDKNWRDTLMVNVSEAICEVIK